MIPAYYLANKRGIPRIESISVQTSATNVTFNFRNHEYLTMNFNGILLVRLGQAIPAGTAVTLPIAFSSGTDSSVLTPTKLNGTPLTVADIGGTGMFLFYYDQNGGTLQIL